VTPEPTGHPIDDGRYILLGRLGSGGMATVFRAWDPKAEQFCAVKVIHSKMSGKKGIRRRFAREAEAMIRMDHPNVILITDVNLEARQPYIVMEIADGGSLDQWMRFHGPMPPRTVIDVMSQVCAGVMAAHDESIVHRDLKPPNVLIDSDGVCRVSDFGIAQVKDTTNLTKTGHAMGTWLYMPPEQRLSAKSVDHRGDIYSLGVLTFALLTGETPPDLCLADRDPSIMDAIDPRFRSIVQTASSFLPEDRYPRVQELLAAMSDLASEFPPPDEPTSLALPRHELQPLDDRSLLELSSLLDYPMNSMAQDSDSETVDRTQRTDGATFLPHYLDQSTLDAQQQRHQTSQDLPEPASKPPPPASSPPRTGRRLRMAAGLSLVPFLAALAAFGLAVALGTTQVQRAAIGALDAESALDDALTSGIYDDLVQLGAASDSLSAARLEYASSDDVARFRTYATVLVNTGDGLLADPTQNDPHRLRLRTRLTEVHDRLDGLEAHHRNWRRAGESLQGQLAIALRLAPESSSLP